MEQQVQNYANILTSKKWIYKSEGKWNEKIFNFNVNNTVDIELDYENDQSIVEWGLNGIALWFKEEEYGQIVQCFTATKITDERIDWLKINSDERVYMLKECDD